MVSIITIVLSLTTEILPLNTAFDQQKNANSDDQKQTALQLCDDYCGPKRVSQIERMNREPSFEPVLNELLSKLQIGKESKCLQAKARGT